MKVKSKAKNPKVFVDKSGVDASKAKVNSEIEKRIKEVNLKPEGTLQSFLQPIEPNFNRTMETQIKQLPEDAQNIVLKLQKEALAAAKEYQELKKKIPDNTLNDLKRFTDMLPSLGSINMAEAGLDFVFGAPSDKAKAVIKFWKATKSKAREIELKNKQAQAKKVKTSKELEEDISKRMKELDELLKKNPIKMTSEKGKPVPVKV